jgi:predicted AlkP superfamily pyrophosphatase or phosphodiesterase
MLDSSTPASLNSTTDLTHPGRNIVIFVADGLRPSSVTPTDAPTLSGIRQNGVNFSNSHSLFPTFTTPNASAIATGHYLGDTGDFSNTIYAGYPVPTSNSSPTPFIENDPILGDIDERFGGNFLSEDTLLAYARSQGYNTAAVGKLGPTLIQDVTQGNPGTDGKVPVPQTIILDDSTGRTGGIPLSADLTQRLINAGVGATTPDRTNGVAATDRLSNGNSGSNTTPGTQAANVVQQRFFTNAVTQAILPKFAQDGNPFAMVYWSRDPDGTQHNQGDSLDSLTPGINGATSKAAVKNADNNLAALIQSLKDQGLYDNTDIFITADHGFSTISKQLTDTQGGKVTAYAASQTYPGVNPGYLPAGFVAIDLAHELGLPLYDADTKSTDGKSYAAVDPTQGQRPRNGDGLIGGSGVIPPVDQAPDSKVIVAANGGSDLIYVPDKDPATVKRIVEFLSKQDYTSGVFVDDALGNIPGALPLSSINLKGSTSLPNPTIVVNFKTFATDSSNPAGSQVEIADTGLQQGQGMHGSFGRGDTFNNMAAIGPDFKAGFNDIAPVSNADVATTLASILGFNIPSTGNLQGRVISEALAGNPDSVKVTTNTVRSDAASNGQRTYLNYQQVGETKYFDAAGFPDRTVGLNTAATASEKYPKVILISLDGATPRLVNQYLDSGVLSPNEGMGLLASKGVVAQQNQTITPSLTAPGHVAIATGSSAANNDINSNSFHLVASPFTQNISGFGAPIGGYSISIDGAAASADPTAEPLWIALRNSGKKVVAATFPGADGVDVKIPGLANSPIVQSSGDRTVDYTVPFGEFGGVGAQGFTLKASDFSAAPSTTADQLAAAGKVSYSPVLQKTTPLDKFTVGGVSYTIDVAAFDTTNDNKVDYDTLVFFDENQGIKTGASLPATGSAFVRAGDQKSSPFYLEGSSNKAGTGFYVSTLAPDLSTVRIARYSVNDIPRNAAVLDNVDDINNNVGFWAPQADFRIPEKLSPGFAAFPDSDLEAIYEDQVKTFVNYQTRVALRALSQVPDADLGLFYIEQPDGSEHQFLITDPRQATNPLDPNSIGAGQDQAKIARYQSYVEAAYKAASDAVQAVIQSVGVDSNGVPKSNIIVTSDHGFSPFYTSVNLNNYLKNSGFDPTKVRAVTSGPAVNIYFNLKGREPNGTVSKEEYVTLQQQVTEALKKFADTNPNYTYGKTVSVFDKVYDRPIPTNINDPSFGLGTSDYIGQDSGDVFALLTEGYNFDGTQSPVVTRLGDDASTASVLSVPNFYGAHGYDPTLPNMSAIFYAAGPDFGKGTIDRIQNIDLAPTIDKLLGVQPAATVQGQPIDTLKR